MRFRLKCSCVRAYLDPVFRNVNIVTKENREAPMVPCSAHEWSLRNCPKCSGRGYTLELAQGQLDVEAMKRDFAKKIAFKA